MQEVDNGTLGQGQVYMRTQYFLFNFSLNLNFSKKYNPLTKKMNYNKN